MGYCSMMTSSEFTSNLSEAEIQMIFTEHKNIADDYVVVVAPHDMYGNVCSLEPASGEWNDKHYHDKTMAEFISQVISPGEETDLTFMGDEENFWGYRIGRNRIRSLGATIKVDITEMTENELEAEIKVLREALRIAHERNEEALSEIVDEVLLEEVQ